MYCTNNNWLKEKSNSSLGYALFNNGYYDFKKNKFYDKITCDFKGEIVFFGKFHFNYDINTNTEEEKLIGVIKDTFFTNPLGNDVGEYFITNIARALAGDMMKRMLFNVGPSNAGKTLISLFILAAFGDYAGSFNGENLAHKTSNLEEAQIMRFLLLHRYKRIIFSNEMKSSVELNGNMIKKCASGGDNLIGRGMGKEEVEFTAHPLFIVFSNDMNKITPYDDAVDNRARVISYTKICKNKSEEELNQYELKMDETLKDKIKTIEYQKAFIKLLLQYYQLYLTNGEKDEEPSVIDLFLKSFRITDEIVKTQNKKTKVITEDYNFVKSRYM